MFKVVVGKCGTCGLDVRISDDVVTLEIYSSGFSPNPAMFAIPQHILPIVENERVACPGFPSIAQYLEGQPRDPQEDDYSFDLQRRYRAAYKRMQAS